MSARAVDAVLAGDRDAFRVLVDRESAAVIRACHRVLGDLHEAEDAAQEAFVTAFRSLAGWRADGPFGAWLTRIAVRIALRRAQKPARRHVDRPDRPGSSASICRAAPIPPSPRSAPSARPTSGPPCRASTSPIARSSPCASSAT